MSNSSNGSSRSYHGAAELRTSVTIILVSDVIFLVLSVLINSWLLASILTSAQLRRQVRNLLICSLAVLYLTLALILAPFEIASSLSYIHRWTVLTGCSLDHYTQVMNLVGSVVTDFLVASLAFVFLAQVLNFNVSTKLKPLQQRGGKLFLLVFPWVFAAVAAPLSLMAIKKEGSRCHYADWSKYFVVETVYTVVPLCLAAGVTATAATLACTRFARANVSGQARMGGPGIDSSLAYIAAVLLSAVCEICMLTMYFEMSSGKFRGLVYFSSAAAVSTSRRALLPLVFLLLADIRRRVFTWRPWRRDVQASDLEIAYKPED